MLVVVVVVVVVVVITLLFHPFLTNGQMREGAYAAAAEEAMSTLYTNIQPLPYKRNGDHMALSVAVDERGLIPEGGLLFVIEAEYLGKSVNEQSLGLAVLSWRLTSTYVCILVSTFLCMQRRGVREGSAQEKY